MNSPKVVVALGLMVIFSILLTACGGGSKAPTPPAGPPTLRTATLPSGAINSPYNAVLSATGGTGTYTWSISSGSLPPGLTLNSTTGVISGTPTAVQAGGYPFTAQVTDSASKTATANLNIYVEGVVSITPAVLPSGSVGVFYSQTLMATGGLAPYTWCVLAGSTCDPTQASLPAGLSLNGATGVLSGTPTTNGPPTTFTIQVTDCEGSSTPPCSDSQGVPAVGASNFTLTIMTITPNLPAGYINTAYPGMLTVAGGLATPNGYTWSANLPPGLFLDPATCIGAKSLTCLIKGTPTQTGLYPVTVTVTDGEKSNPAMVTANLSITIYPSQLIISTTSLPAGIEGIPYSATLTASGGVKPYNWSITSGSLPAGLSLDPATCTNSSVPCIISGTPTSPGTTGFTVQVQDTGSPQQTGSAQLSIFINAPLGNGNLSGNYVFNFAGYNSGTPVFMAGAFVADGKGNISSGELDYNDGSGEGVPPVQQTFTTGSVYSITPDGLGTMTIVTGKATYQFAIVVTSDGSGKLIQSDPANKQAYGSGAIKVQTISSVCPAFHGVNVAVGLFGFDSSLKRYAGAGQFTFNNSTCADITGVMDFDDNGSPACGSAPCATFSGAFNGGDNFGRSYLQIQNWNPASSDPCGDKNGMKGTCTYAAYVVTQNEIVIVATDAISQPATLTLWSVLRQLNNGIGFDNTALGGASVQQLNALDTNNAVDVTAGLFTGSGVAGHTCQSNNYDPATFSFDENQGGTCNGGTCSQPQTSQGTYCVDKTTGRVSLTGFSGAFGGSPPVFYVRAGAQGFAVGTDPAVTSGYFQQQTGSPFSTSSISGIYPGGTINPITTNVTNSVSVLIADGNGNINGTENTSGPGGPGQQPFTYTYTVDGTGRAVVQQNGSTIGIGYVISPQNFVLLPATDPNPALSVFSSGTGN